MDRKFITKNVKELGKKRLETLTENQKKQIKKLPKNEREILRLKLMSRKREVRAMISIINKFFNATQEFKMPMLECPKCKTDAVIKSKNIEILKEVCIATDSYRKLWCKACNHKWEDGNKALRNKTL